MNEFFDLTAATPPAIPSPHDCVISNIEINEDFLTFYFEDEIFRRDSVKFLHPNAKSLVIRIHLSDPLFFTYKHKFNKLNGKDKYVAIKSSELKVLSKHGFEYLYNYVGCGSLIIKLWQNGCILLDITADYIEFEWIE